jgi:hypothetical protein
VGYGSGAWADDQSGTQDGYARARFFGQAVINLTFYENKTCYGGSGVIASKTGGLGGLFKRVKNISVGMPETPNVINLKQRDGILSNAFYREYSVNAGQSLTISASLNETTGRTGYSCGLLNGSFIPETGKDYEVALDISDGICHLNVTQVDSTQAEVKLLPVALSMAMSCSDKQP